jgi:hypothetical protein
VLPDELLALHLGLHLGLLLGLLRLLLRLHPRLRQLHLQLAHERLALRRRRRKLGDIGRLLAVGRDELLEPRRVGAGGGGQLLLGQLSHLPGARAHAPTPGRSAKRAMPRRAGATRRTSLSSEFMRAWSIGLPWSMGVPRLLPDKAKLFVFDKADVAATVAGTDTALVGLLSVAFAGADPALTPLL